MQYLSKYFSIRDLAKECGISVATASKALYGYNDISPKTRELLIQTAQKHGYIPNYAAQKLKRLRSRNVVLLLRDPWHPFAQSIIITYNEVTKRKNYKLVIRYVNEEDLIVAALRAIKENKAAGIAILGDTIAGREKEVGRFGIPVILLEMDKQLDLDGIDNASCFYINEIEESYRMTQYLIGKGAKEVAFFTTEVEGDKVGALRTRGYKMALEDAGIPVDPARIVVVKDSYFRSGYEGVKDLLNKGVSFSALLCTSDRVVLGGSRALYENGILVPDDVIAAGFDGSDFTDYTVPTITAINIPIRKMYQDSAEHLMERISGNAEPLHKCYSCKIEEKESTQVTNRAGLLPSLDR